MLDEDRNEVELIETSEYGNTDINAIIGNDRDDRDYAFEDSESFENTDLPSRSSIPRMKSLSM